MIIFQTEFPESSLRLDQAVVKKTTEITITYDLSRYDSAEIKQTIDAHYALDTQTIIENNISYVVRPKTKKHIGDTLKITYNVLAIGAK